MNDSSAPSSSPKENVSLAPLKLLLEFGPLFLFLVTFWLAGIITATKVFMVAVVIALVASRVVFGKVAAMPVIVAIFVTVFGGLTIWFNDDVFIKLKPTIVNLLFAGLLLGGLAFGKSLLRVVFQDAFQLTEEGWRALTWRWAFFFVFLALLNEFVWRNFATSTWVTFKTFGIITLTMIFGAAQIGLINRHTPKSPSSNVEGNPGDIE